MRLLTTLGIVLIANLLAALPAAAEFRAGFGSRVVTPQNFESWTDADGDAQYSPDIDTFNDTNGNGVFDAAWMAGFQNGRAANNVHDDLMAVAAVFDDGETRIGIVTADVVGLMANFVASVRTAVPPELELDYVLVHATHNHEGPDTQGLWGAADFESGVSETYMARLKAEMVGALEDSVAALEPARLSMATIDGYDAALGTMDTRKPLILDPGIRVLMLKRPSRDEGNDSVIGTLVAARSVDVPLANYPLAAASLLGLLDRDFDVGLLPPQLTTETEVALLKIGQARVAAIPGELYPEIAVGGIENPSGADYEMAPIEVPPFRPAMQGRVNLMVNLANDAIGYIIPKSEWDNEAPWIYDYEEETYGEVVSVGPDGAPSEGIKAVAAGMNPMDLKRGIDLAVAAALADLTKRSKKVKSNEEIAQVGKISANGETEIGDMIAEAMSKVGNEGVITVEEAKSLESELDVVEGMQFDRGYLSPYFITNPDKMTVEQESPLILLHESKLTSLQAMLPILEAVVQSSRPLLIIAEDIEGEALATLVVNKLRGGLKIAAVKAPGFGDRRKAMLEDIAILTGGTVISEDLGIKLENVTLDMLGTAKSVGITKDDTTIVDGAGKKKDIEARVAQIRAQIEETSSDYDREKLQERLAKLAGGVAVLKVGGATEVEVKERKDRVDDALNATRAAVEEGIVPGGGSALLRATKAVSAVTSDNADIMAGVKIVLKALESPIRQIAENAGVEGSIVVATVLGKAGSYGFDAQNETYVDLVAEGIIDPTKVVRTALTDASSVAGLLITTEAMIADKPSEGGAPAMPDMGGMGGMGEVLLDDVETAGMAFAQEYGLYEDITFNTEVVETKFENEGWQVTLSTGETRRYRWLICVNGTNWHPTLPDWADGPFDGDVRHANSFRHMDEFRGKRVLIVGAGNSGCDIACDAAAAADDAFISLRRGYHFIPKHLMGKPADVFAHEGPHLPMWLTQKVFGLLLRFINGDLTRLGLPAPDHKIFESHPILNTQLLHYLGHGDIKAKGDVERLEGQHVVFKDGSREEIDLVLCATGYEWKIPYVDPPEFTWKAGRPDLYINLFVKGHANLFSLGFMETNGGAYKLFDNMADLIARAILAERDQPKQAKRFHKRLAAHQPDLSGGALRDQGDHLVLTDRSGELSALSSGSAAELIDADLCIDEDLQRLCMRLESGEPAIDLLINNAGIGINLTAPMRLAQAAARGMLTRGKGQIFNIVSLAGLFPLKDSAAYTASKFGLRGFTAALALELEPHGIKVGGLYPSAIDTPMLREEMSHPDGSPLNFAGNADPLSAEETAQRVMQALGSGDLETWLPKSEGRMASLVMAFPKSLQRVFRYMEKQGNKKKQTYLASLHP
eukprot:g4668.t1